MIQRYLIWHAHIVPLIEPYGIEICIFVFAKHYGQFPLIEPYGIEINETVGRDGIFIYL